MKIDNFPLVVLSFSLIFNGLYIVKFGSNIKSFYFFLLISLFALFYLKKEIEIKLHHVLIPFYLFFTGYLNSLYGNTNFFKVFFQSSAIFVCLVIFYNSFNLYFNSNKNSKKNFANTYTNIIFFYTLVSLIIFIFKKSITDDPQIRLFGLMAEPSVLSIVIMPALLFSIKSAINKFNTYNIIYCIIFLFAIYETKSTLGYFGIITLPFFLLNKIQSKLIVVFLCIVFSISLISISSQISHKFNELLIFFSDGNLFSFAGPTSVTFYINAVIAIKSFISNPIIGNGIGSHAISYFENVYSIPGTHSLPTKLYIGLNYNDANSLLFRIISETGLVGIICLLYFMIKFYSPNIYSNMSLILLTLMLIRQGNFINPEFFIFIYFYYFNYKYTKI